MFPKNTWYVAASAFEITDKPLGRKVCNEPMVFYRGPDKRIAALEARGVDAFTLPVAVPGDCTGAGATHDPSHRRPVCAVRRGAHAP